MPQDLVVEEVDHGDMGVDLDGLAIEIGGAIAPLVDGVEGGIVEERIAGEDFQRLDGPVGGNDGAQFDPRFMVESDGETRVDRLNAIG